VIGTVALGHRSRHRGFRLGVALGLMFPMALLLVFSVWPWGGGSDVPAQEKAQRRALAFEEDLKPVIDAGASVVVYGMRPGIVDIYEGNFADETLVAMSESWAASMRNARKQLAVVEAPAFLAEAARLYAASFDEYVALADGLVASAKATGEERVITISGAAAHGERADELYEAAKAEVERHRSASTSP
jgi:hypothetical protein